MLCSRFVSQDGLGPSPVRGCELKFPLVSHHAEKEENDCLACDRRVSFKEQIIRTKVIYFACLHLSNWCKPRYTRDAYSGPATGFFNYTESDFGSK